LQLLQTNPRRGDIFILIYDRCLSRSYLLGRLCIFKWMAVYLWLCFGITRICEIHRFVIFMCVIFDPLSVVIPYIKYLTWCVLCVSVQWIRRRAAAKNIINWKYWTIYTCRSRYPVKASANLYIVFFFIMVLYDISNLIKMLKNYFIFIFSGAGDARSCKWVTEWHHWRVVDKLEKSYREIKYLDMNVLLVQICSDLCVLQYNLKKNLSKVNHWWTSRTKRKRPCCG